MWGGGELINMPPTLSSPLSISELEVPDSLLRNQSESLANFLLKECRDEKARSSRPNTMSWEQEKSNPALEGIRTRALLPWREITDEEDP